MARKTDNHEFCSADEAQQKLKEADSYVAAAAIILAEIADHDTDFAIAASLAVLAGIAASDAACCAKLQRRPSGASHNDSIDLIAQVVPGGEEMAKDLRSLIARKDDSNHGFIMVGAKRAGEMVQVAARLTANARQAVES